MYFALSMTISLPIPRPSHDIIIGVHLPLLSLSTGRDWFHDTSSDARSLSLADL